MVTPSILSDVTHSMPDKHGGRLKARLLRRQSVTVPGGSSRRQIILTDGFVRRRVRAGLYPADGPTAAQLVEDYDVTLFCRLMNSEQHVLHQLLPSQSAATTQSFPLY